MLDQLDAAQALDRRTGHVLHGRSRLRIERKEIAGDLPGLEPENQIDQVPVGLSQTYDHMAIDLHRAEQAPGRPDDFPVMAPIMRPARTTAAGIVEELLRGGVQTHADDIHAGLTDRHQLVFVQGGGADQGGDRHRRRFLVDASGDIDQVRVGAAILHLGDANPPHAARRFLIGDLIGDEIGGVKRPTHTDERLLFSHPRPFAGQAAIGAIGGATHWIGLQEIDAPAAAAPHEPATLQSQFHGSGHGNADVIGADQAHVGVAF